MATELRGRKNERTPSPLNLSHTHFYFPIHPQYTEGGWEGFRSATARSTWLASAVTRLTVPRSVGEGDGTDGGRKEETLLFPSFCAVPGLGQLCLPVETKARCWSNAGYRTLVTAISTVSLLHSLVVLHNNKILCTSNKADQCIIVSGWKL